MKYVDGFVIPVPKENLQAYREMAELGATMWKKHGALQYFECVGDDLNTEMAGIKFPETVKAGLSEVVVFSFIVFKSREHRDEVNAKVMKDMEKMGDMKEMPFDMKRMAYGGFKVIVEA